MDPVACCGREMQAFSRFRDDLDGALRSCGGCPCLCLDG